MSEDITQLSGDPHDLVASFALDALDPKDARRFAEHLATCRSCRNELDALSETAAAYGSSMRFTPPPALERRLMASLFEPASKDGDVTAIRRRPRWHWPIAAAAAFLLGAGLVTTVGHLAGFGSGAQVVAEAQQITEIAGAPDAHFMPLDVEVGSIKLMVSEEMDSAAIMATGLPIPDKGMQYRVWTIMADGTTMPAATFVPDGTGNAAVILDADVHDASGFLLTVDSTDASYPSDERIAQVLI